MRFVHLVYALLISLVLPQFVQAITITASPNPALIDQQVDITISATFPAPDICSIQVNFGDNSGWQIAGNCDGIANCVSNVNHSYSSPGNYRIQARSNPTCIELPIPPDPASYNLNVVQPLEAGEELPIGIAGIMYKHQLATSGGTGAIRFQLISGQLPPGIRLSSQGLLSGIPTREDSYNFRLRISDQAGQSIAQDYLLIVGQADLNVTVTPNQQSITRNQQGSYQLKYTFTSSEPLDDTVRSFKGVFYAGNRQVGVLNTRVTATIRRGKGQATEQVIVPLSIIQAAERLGVQQLRYSRVFEAVYMEAKTIASTVIPVGIGFTITEMRLYFENQQGKTTVKRNERNVAVFVDIRYEGAGTLAGYWEADGRILKPVREQLSYTRDRVITLELRGPPKDPPLPTFSFGSHRLRFVLTRPVVSGIRIPEAIYMVSQEGLAEQFPILLESPADNERVGWADLDFTWQKRLGITTYKVEFYLDKAESPIFQTFTKTESYKIPALLVERHFADIGTYWWMVSGYNADDELSAQSKMFSFYLFNDQGTASE